MSQFFSVDCVDLLKAAEGAVRENTVCQNTWTLANFHQWKTFK
jgi:hypothetical protein